MLAKKTIKAKILELRKGKQQHLEREYANFQLYLQGDKMVPLYSATKQQAERFLKRIKRPKEGKEYPLILRNDVYRIDRSKAGLTEYWLKVPISNVRGGIFVPIKPHTHMPDNVKFGEAKIIRKKGEWFVYITVEAEVAERRVDSVLAVDVGVHNIAATVNSKDPKPRFYGKALRRVQGHYFHLRRKLGEKKALKAIKNIGSHEQRIVNHELHKISKAIVQEALENSSLIVLGNLKGVRQNGRGRRFNRKLNSFPYHKLASFIKYKAQWQGIPVLKVSEAYTSQQCSRCGQKGLRVRGLFKCPHCGLNLNADWNGARNILKRALGHVSSAGAAFDTAQNFSYGQPESNDERRIFWL
jgi:putative transposase